MSEVLTRIMAAEEGFLYHQRRHTFAVKAKNYGQVSMERVAEENGHDAPGAGEIFKILIWHNACERSQNWVLEHFTRAYCEGNSGVVARAGGNLTMDDFRRHETSFRS